LAEQLIRAARSIEKKIAVHYPFNRTSENSEAFCNKKPAEINVAYHFEY